MTFPISLFLLRASVLSFVIIALECKENFIDNKSSIVEETSVAPRVLVTKPLLEITRIVRLKMKSQAAIIEIHKDAVLCAESGGYLMAVSAIEDGLKAAIELVAASSDVAGKALERAIAKACDNPEAAIKIIQKGMKTAQELIYDAGYPVYFSFKAAAEVTDDESKKFIKLGLQFPQQGGAYAIASLGAAESVSINGFKSNTAAATKGLDYAQEALLAGYEAAFESLVLAGKSAYKGLSDNVTRPNEKDQQICKPRTTPRSAEAEAAKSAIISKAQRALKSMRKGPVANALNTIKESLICGIEAAAAGESSALKALSIATEMASNEPDIAIGTLNAGFTSLKSAIITAGNETCQGLDAARNILKNKKIIKIVSDISRVGSGISSSLAGIETAEKLVSAGLKIGGDVAVLGLKAACKSVLAVLFVFYSILVTIGEEAF